MCSNRESRMFPLTMITPSESIISSPPGVNRTKLELYMKCGEAFVSLALSAAPPCSPCVTLSFVVLRGSQEVMLLRGRAEYCCLWLQTSCLCVCVCVCVYCMPAVFPHHCTKGGRCVCGQNSVWDQKQDSALCRLHVCWCETAFMSDAAQFNAEGIFCITY